MKLLILLVLLLAGCSHSGIPASAAKSHIGERQTVSGKVFQTKLTRGGTVLLDIGGVYPNEQFTIVQFHGDYAALSKFKGKTITVNGTIKSYRGKPEIIVTSPGEISP